MTLHKPVILIRYDSTIDVSRWVIYESVSIDSQMAGQPGLFEMRIRDDRLHPPPVFKTGRRLEIFIDEKPVFGGFILSISQTHAFPVVDTTKGLSKIKTRQWILRGADYNILFDKLVVRQPTDYIHNLPGIAKWVYDDTVVDTLLLDFLDLPPWLTKDIDRVEYVTTNHVGMWVSQGDTWRTQLRDFALYAGQLYWISPTGEFKWKAVESVKKDWGFSDVPGGSFIGFRELVAIEDGGGMVNDAMAWGGDDFTGSQEDLSDGGRTVFARYQDTASIAEHGRWQWGEQHNGDPNWASQAQVDRRVQRVVDGAPGVSTLFATSGLKFPQWRIQCVWFDNDVPDQDYLVATEYVDFRLETLGDDSGPLEITLPCRSMRTSFPILQTDPDDPTTSHPVVRFEGSFGIELNDSEFLWRAILDAKLKIKNKPRVDTSNDGSKQTYHGTYGQFIPLDEVNGVQRIYTIKYPYMKGSSAVYVNGLRKSLGLKDNDNDYQESDPVNGEITFSKDRIPPAGAAIYVEVRTLAALAAASSAGSAPAGSGISTGGTPVTSGGVPVTT